MFGVVNMNNKKDDYSESNSEDSQNFFTNDKQNTQNTELKSHNLEIKNHEKDANNNPWWSDHMQLETTSQHKQHMNAVSNQQKQNNNHEKHNHKHKNKEQKNHKDHHIHSPKYPQNEQKPVGILSHRSNLSVRSEPAKMRTVSFDMPPSAPR